MGGGCKVEVQPEDLPGFKGPRVVCAECGEGINFKREVVKDGRTLCRACAGERYTMQCSVPKTCFIGSRASAVLQLHQWSSLGTGLLLSCFSMRTMT